MLNENIRIQRKMKGLSQEELAIKLNIVRQTVSKWEKGLSVPDSKMLLRIADALDISVSDLLGEPCSPDTDTDILKTLAAKLEVLNGQYLQLQEQKRSTWRILFIILAVVAVVCFLHRISVFGTLFSIITTPPTNSNSGIPITEYIYLFLMCIRMFLFPIIIGIVAAIGLYKTKKDS